MEQEYENLPENNLQFEPRPEVKMSPPHDMQQASELYKSEVPYSTDYQTQQLLL